MELIKKREDQLMALVNLNLVQKIFDADTHHQVAAL